MHISLVTAAIPVNYTGEFRKILKLLFIIVTTKSVNFVKFGLGQPAGPPPPPPPSSSRWWCPCFTEKAETHVRSGGIERSIFTIAGNRTEFLLSPPRNQVIVRSKPSRPCLVQYNDHLICRSKEAETSMNFFMMNTISWL